MVATKATSLALCISTTVLTNNEPCEVIRSAATACSTNFITHDNCCEFFSSYYEENCQQSDTTTTWTRWALGVVAILILCGTVQVLAKKYCSSLFPINAAWSIIVGVLIGVTFQMQYTILLQKISASDFLLRVLLPPVMFHRGLIMPKTKVLFLRKLLILPTLTFGFFGTILCTYITGTLLRALLSFSQDTILIVPSVENVNSTSLPKLESYLFGALIHSMDMPDVSLLLNPQQYSSSSFNNNALYNTIFGETLINNGVTIVLFQVLVKYFNTHDTMATFERLGNSDSSEDTSLIVYHIGVKFVMVMLMSISVGCITGTLSTICFWVTKEYQRPSTEIALFVCWALVPYFLCESLHLSGIVSLIATAFIMDIFILGGTETTSTATPSSNLNAILNTADPDDDGTIRVHHHHFATSSDDGHQYINFRTDDDDPLSEEEEGENISIVEWHHSRHVENPVFYHSTGHLSSDAHKSVKLLFEGISALAETAILAYLGFYLFAIRWSDAKLGAFAIVISTISRAFMVCLFALIIKICFFCCYSCCGMSASSSQSSSSVISSTFRRSHHQTKSLLLLQVLQWRNQIVLMLAGTLRTGIVAFALVESIPTYNAETQQQGSHYKAELECMTIVTILFSVFVLSNVSYFLVQHIFTHNNNIIASQEQQTNVKDDQSLAGELEDRLMSDRTQFHEIFS